MKLLYQINIAFGILLVAVLSVTAVIIHYVLMDQLVEAKRKDLKEMGLTMSAQMLQASDVATTAGSFSVAGTAISLTPVGGVQAVITDDRQQVVYSTLSATKTLPASLTAAAAAGAPLNIPQLQAGKDSRFVVDASPIPQGTLTLFAPVSTIRAIEQSLLGRLLLVLCIGGIIVFLLSLFITRRLIRPLGQLKGELKKAEGRRFSAVRKIRAGGEIGAVARAVHEMAVELDGYTRVQKQFIQNASHELKTPLMSIAGYAEGIRDGVFEGEGVRKGLDVIIRESVRMKKIVTEMTLLAKLDSEEDIFTMSEVSVKEMVAETIERINPLLAKGGLTVRTEIDGDAVAIRADRDKLLQALLNVTANATRYAAERILIRVGIARRQVEIAVIDDGAGFPEGLLPHLFHRFVKGKDGDTGLGLAISRAIVERCGGSIAAGNVAGGGASITMTFPAGAA